MTINIRLKELYNNQLFIIFIVSVTYFLSAKIIAPLSFSESNSVFAIWPPTGVALSSLLIFGYRSWPGITIGAFVLNMTITPVLPSIQISITNTLGPLFAAFIINKLVKPFHIFSRTRYIMIFFGSIVVAAIITASGGTFALWFHKFTTADKAFSVWHTWMFGDLIGFLLIVPMLSALKLEPLQKLTLLKTIEGICILFTIFFVGMFIFGPLAPFDLHSYPIEYFMLTPLLWATLSFGPIGASISLSITAILTIAGSIYNYGPFIRDNLDATLILLQSFNGIIGVTVLLLATVLKQKDDYQRSLQHAKESLSEAQKIAHIGYWEFDIIKNSLYWSDETYRIFGLNPQEFAATYEALFEYIHPEDRNAVDKAYKHSIETKSSYQIIHRIIRPSGELRHVEERCSHEFDNKNNFVRSIGTVHDITELKQMEEKLRVLNISLEKKVQEELDKRRKNEQLLIQQSKLAAMGEMIGAIAHQWRQPLNNLGFIVQDIEDAYEYGELDSSYIKNSVQLSMEQVQFMSRTIDDFRNFFRPSEGRVTFNAVNAIKEVIRLISPQIEHNFITIELDCYSCESLSFMGYHTEFMQVIVNLINNAKDAILERKKQNLAINYNGEILISTYEKADTINISIADNGGGIPETIIDRIFEPYFTTKEEGKGTGIGLYMSKVIIENNMNGKIYVENVDDGAMFNITLPLRRQSETL